MLPLVSIIIPVYNAERYIADAIHSAVNQTFKELEFIIVDDGSNDSSPDIIQSISDPRIILISQRNKGGSAARNRGLEMAKGEYIKFLDADDILLPDAIKKQLEQSKNLGDNEIVFGDFNFMNSEGKITMTNKFEDSGKLTVDSATFFLANWKILISCPLHKKEYLLRIGGFDEKLPFGQESDLHFRLALNSFEFKYQPGMIFQYRSHTDVGRISTKRLKKKRELWAMVYSLDKKIKLLEELKGELDEAQQEYFSRSYFGLARNSFMQGNKTEGRYYLSRSKQYSKSNLPPFKQGLFWGLFYQLTGYLIGYIRLEKLIGKVRGNTGEVSKELAVLIKQ